MKKTKRSLILAVSSITLSLGAFSPAHASGQIQNYRAVFENRGGDRFGVILDSEKIEITDLQSQRTFTVSLKGPSTLDSIDPLPGSPLNAIKRATNLNITPHFDARHILNPAKESLKTPYSQNPELSRSANLIKSFTVENDFSDGTVVSADLFIEEHMDLRKFGFDERGLLANKLTIRIDNIQLYKKEINGDKSFADLLSDKIKKPIFWAIRKLSSRALGSYAEVLEQVE